MKYVVYCHLFPNGKRYIGITSAKPIYRWNSGNGYSGQVLMCRAINKYGWSSIEHIILAEDLSKQEACQLEQFYITKYRTTDIRYGYNLTAGGEGHTGYSPSPETRQKLSAAIKGQKRSEEFRRACSDRMKGKKLSEETTKKISEGLKRRGNSFVTEEYRRKLSLAHMGNTNTRGTVQSAETKKKISESLKGVPKSEETKAKMRKPKSEEARANMKKAQELRWRKYYEDKQLDLSRQSGGV